MHFEALSLDGVFVVHPERHLDERGFFVRTFGRNEFLASGLKDCCLECSLSHNASPGTVRGMHFQRSPHGETKLVRCSRGAIFDVAVDVRKESSTFGRWLGIELSVENGLAVYIPSGFAHGYVTLRPDTDVVYQMAEPFVREAAAGFRWDDPAVGIEWPIAPAMMSAKDANLPTLREAAL